MRPRYDLREALGVQTLTPVQTTVPAGLDTHRATRPRWRVAVMPLVVGLALGPLDLLLQVALPYPFANLANSTAVWALVAFVVGWATRGRALGWPAVAGTVTLLLAVEGYYATAVLALGDDPATLTNMTALMWLAFAVVAGVVFGTSGAWARTSRRWLGPLGTAAAVGVLLAEAWRELAQASGAGDDPTFRHDLIQTAVVLLVLAVVTAVLGGRSARQRVVGSVLALPLALLGALAFTAVGLG